MKKPHNPFLISGYQGPSFFCNRTQETKTIVSAIENGRNLTLMSLRRMGKTGLIRHSFHQLNPKKFNVIYVDLLHTTDIQTLAREFAKASINQLSIGVMKTSLQKITSFFSSVRPTFTIDPLTGSPSVEIDIQRIKEGEKTIEEVFSLLEKQSIHVVVAFDEFQTITTYPEKNMEARLRSQIQHLNNVNFIYSGSQKHILSSMFGDAKRPFYQSTQFLGLEPITSSDYTLFINNHFKQEGLKISEDEIEFIIAWTYCHTFYIQYFCNRLFDMRKDDPKSSLYLAVEKIFQENEAVFSNYRTLLTLQQSQLLTALAKEGFVNQPTSKDFLSKHKLTSSLVQRALPSLIQKEFVQKKRMGIVYTMYSLGVG